MFKSKIKLFLLTSIFSTQISLNAFSMEEEQERIKNAKNNSGSVRKYLQEEQKKEFSENKSASKSLNRIFWNEENDDATEHHDSETRKKRNKLLEILGSSDLNEFLNTYYNNEEPEIYEGKQIVKVITTEGQWVAPKNMRQAIGLLSPEDVDTVFRMESLSL